MDNLSAPKSALRPSRYTNRAMKIKNDIIRDAEKTLFGSMIGEISDYYAERISAALVDGVSTLPCLDKEKQEQMSNPLHQKFMKAVDVFELYCNRNIFSLRNLPSKCLNELIRRHKELPEGAIPDIMEVPEVNIDDHDYSYEPEISSPSQVPTNEQVTALQKELEHLKQIRAETMKRRASLEQGLQRWNSAQTAADLMTQSVEQVLDCPEDQVVEPVASIVEISNNIVSAIHQAQGQMDELSNISKRSKFKRERDVGIFVVGAGKKPKSTFDDRVKARKEICCDENTVNALFGLIRKI